MLAKSPPQGSEDGPAEIAGSKVFLRHLHAFRGFAILTIVLYHAFSDQVWRSGGPEASTSLLAVNAVNETLFHAGTLYFSLISGLLFSIVLRSRGWHAFFTSKISNVILPYIVITLLFTLLSDVGGLAPFQGSFPEYLAAAARNILTGGAFFHLWYIPVLCGLYLATPLIAWLLTKKFGIWAVALIALAPLVASRTWPPLTLPTLIYFTGAYAAGMLAGHHYGAALKLFRRAQTALIAAVLIASAILLAMFVLKIEPLRPVSQYEGLFYIQKLALAALVLAWFHACEVRLPRFLDTLGTHAFSLYFLHAYPIVVIGYGLSLSLPGFAPAWFLVLAGMASAAVSIAACLAISVGLRRLIGKRSRMLIGA